MDTDRAASATSEASVLGAASAVGAAPATHGGSHRGRLLVDWVYAPPVGHATEGFKFAEGFARAKPDLRSADQPALCSGRRPAQLQRARTLRAYAADGVLARADQCPAGRVSGGGGGAAGSAEGVPLFLGRHAGGSGSAGNGISICGE